MTTTLAERQRTIIVVLDTTDRDRIFDHPVEGQVIYDLNADGFFEGDGVAWNALEAEAGTPFAGDGSPEGVVTANVGQLYLQRDAGGSYPVWVKWTGTGSTGWKRGNDFGASGLVADVLDESTTDAGVTIEGILLKDGVATGAFDGDGSLVVALNGSNIATGTVADARLSANVTLMGNTFNGDNELLLLDGSGHVPSAVVVGDYTGITAVGTLSGLTVTGTASLNLTTPATDATYALGSATLRWTNIYASNALIVGTNPATSGLVRIANNQQITWRDNANSTNINGLIVNSSNNVVVGGTGVNALFLTNGAGNSWSVTSAGVWEPTVDNTQDIGTSANYRPRNVYVYTSVSVGATPASTGLVRLTNTGYVYSRNAAGTGDLQLLGADSGNYVVLGDPLNVTAGIKLTVYTKGWTVTGAGYFVPFADNTQVIGTTANRVSEIVVGGDIQIGTNPASVGPLRLANGGQMWARNAANNGDVPVIGLDGSNNIVIGGTGSAAINFIPANLSTFQVSSTGHFLNRTDNTYDIGASGATRPRTGYFGTSIISPLVSATTRVTAPLLGTTTSTNVVVDRNSVTQLTIGSLTATFAGALIVTTNLTASGATATFGSNAGGQTNMYINSAAGVTRNFVFESGGFNRWIFQVTGTAETGSDAGSDLLLLARHDDGTGIDTILTFVRAAGGAVTLDRPLIQTNGGLTVSTVGYGVSIKEGTNARLGSVALVGGTATVANTSVTASTRIFLTSDAPGGTVGFLSVSSRIAGTSFTILSSNALDTSTVSWLLVEPA